MLQALIKRMYLKQLFDESAQPLYPTNCNMASSSNQLESMVLHCEFELFYETPVVCGYLKCKGLKNNSRRVTLSHYINDWLPKVDDLIPPTVVKKPINDIEKTCRNTFSMCSFFDQLEARSTKFHRKLTNVSPSFESTNSSSEPNFDINTTQNMSTRRSKKL